MPRLKGYKRTPQEKRKHTLRHKISKKSIKHSTGVFTDIGNFADIKRKLVQNPDNITRYLFSKARYGIKTYTYNELLKYGADKETIKKYYQREIDLYTGKYEKDRVNVYIKNYIKSLKKNNVKQSLISEMKELLENINYKDFRKIVNFLGEIRLFYNENVIDLEEDIERSKRSIEIILGIIKEI